MGQFPEAGDIDAPEVSSAGIVGAETWGASLRHVTDSGGQFPEDGDIEAPEVRHTSKSTAFVYLPS